ncbi:MAG: ThiF family adenylyltransferase [Flavobacteriales bacterium]|nr:ThiF family adenylyltransferase [Flavobacteriales bacterium]
MRAREQQQVDLVVIGAGAIGCGLLAMVPTLAVASLVVVDGDTISATNLQRQPLYGPADIGEFKANAARDRIAPLVPETIITAVTEFVRPENIAYLLQRATIVADCTDDLHASRSIDAWCADHGTYLVTGSVHGMQCQVTSRFGPDSRDHDPYFLGRIGAGQDGCDMRAVPAMVTQLAAVHMAWRIRQFTCGVAGPDHMDLLDIATGTWLRIAPPMAEQAQGRTVASV